MSAPRCACGAKLDDGKCPREKVDHDTAIALLQVDAQSSIAREPWDEVQEGDWCGCGMNLMGGHCPLTAGAHSALVKRNEQLEKEAGPKRFHVGFEEKAPEPERPGDVAAERAFGAESISKAAEPAFDPVRPSYYKGDDVMQYAWRHRLGACEFQVVKYVTRAAKKNGLEDLKKARWYLEWLITQLESEK